MENHLIRKYNVPGPRYTSYPTVPYWQVDPPSLEDWESAIIRTTSNENGEEGISLYVHLPYCESLCTFCGCNRRITKNHGVEIPYIEAVLKEWEIYKKIIPGTPVISEIHLGGGTPTFFSPDNLEMLITGLLKDTKLSAHTEFSFEGHPGNTSELHLSTLYNLGFRRVSFGIQDFDAGVQKMINRIQTTEQVSDVTESARKIGYTSINYDILYGLPLQTEETVRATIDRVRELRPDRIAFYSYAHVPWQKNGQRKFTEADLPVGTAKRKLYELGKELLESSGYHEIGMDHFALKEDSLYSSFQSGNLHRNFMGYTTCNSKMIIGLGASAISDAWSAFVQNEKNTSDYITAIEEGRLPIFKGHILTDEDLILRRHILNLLCHFETTWYKKEEQCEALYKGIERMTELVKDELITLAPYKCTVTEKGKVFIRNICMPLDARLWRNQPGNQIFSTTT